MRPQVCGKARASRQPAPQDAAECCCSAVDRHRSPAHPPCCCGCRLTQASRADHGPIQTTPLEAALTQPLPNQDQPNRLRMQPTASAEGADQQHALQPQRAAGLHLGLHPPSIHLQGTRQADRRPGARGDYQGRAAVQGMEQGFRRSSSKRRTSRRPSRSA